MIKRRTFIAGLGSIAAWPVVARGQQSAVPVIGFLHSGSPDTRREFVSAFQRGLAEMGYVEKQNVAIEYRWANDQPQRLPVLAADLIRLRVAVIVAAPNVSAVFAAKAASK